MALSRGLTTLSPAAWSDSYKPQHRSMPCASVRALGTLGYSRYGKNEDDKACFTRTRLQQARRTERWERADSAHENQRPGIGPAR
jgi:hypothetical protein